MSRRRILTAAPFALLACLAVWASGLAPLGLAQQKPPDRTTCAGYPEKRVYLEAQSWWEAQPGPADHPGTGKQGHIHVGTCFPLYQRLTGKTLRLDVLLQFHNLPGTVFMLRVAAGENTIVDVPAFRRRCAAADCSEWVHLEVPLSRLRGGWTTFNVFAGAETTDGRIQRPITHWWANVANGKPAAARDMAMSSKDRDVAGESWFPASKDGGTKYAEARIARADFPWDAETGAAKPVSGVWSPNVRFSRDEGLALIDPALHASPPKQGTVVYSRTGAWYRWERLSIDTRALSDGPHRLLLASCHPRPRQEKNCGVLVVPFVVRNDSSAAPEAGDQHGEHVVPSAPTARFSQVETSRARSFAKRQGPRAGRPFYVRARLELTPPGAAPGAVAVSCRARADGRTLRTASWFAGGAAWCRVLVPRASGGKALAVIIAARHGRASTQRAVARRIGRAT